MTDRLHSPTGWGGVPVTPGQHVLPGDGPLLPPMPLPPELPPDDFLCSNCAADEFACTACGSEYNPRYRASKRTASKPVESPDLPILEDLWRTLVAAEMRHRGYSDEEIELASRVPCHTDACEFDWNHTTWDCADDEGKSHHPIADEYGELVDVIGRALDAALPHLRSLQVEAEALFAVLKAHQLRNGPSATCSCGGWTEREYGSVTWSPNDWERHVADALATALQAKE